MPNLASTPPNNIVKMLLIGNSGSGKTGALASLIDEGFKLRILDFDRGLDVLGAFVNDKSKLVNVDYVTLTDEMKASGAAPVPRGLPTAASRGLQLLDNWSYDETGKPCRVKKDQPLPPGVTDFGKPSEWGDDTILVIDSMTFLGNAFMLYVLAVNGRSGKQPWQSDWGEAIRLLESVLQLLYSNSIGCHVIVTSHITYVEPEAGALVGYPSALGQKLPPKVPRYFNTLVLAKTRPSKDGPKRTIQTQSSGVIELKTPVRGIAKELPLSTGLSTLFKEIRKND